MELYNESENNDDARNQYSLFITRFYLMRSKIHVFAYNIAIPMVFNDYFNFNKYTFIYVCLIIYFMISMFSICQLFLIFILLINN